jgi:hypothetical protein
MDCSKAINLIDALADDELKLKQKQELLNHISSCAKCSLKYNEVIKIKQILEKAPGIKAPSDFLSKLHSRMEKENLIEKKESVINILINFINRPLILRPAAAVILSVIIITVYRPHEFLSENLKIGNKIFKSENRNEFPVIKNVDHEAKKEQKEFKLAVANKKEKQAKRMESTDLLEVSDSNRTIREADKDDSSAPIAEKKEDKKIIPEESYSVSQKSKSGLSKSSDEEAPAGRSYIRKSSGAESMKGAETDSLLKPSSSSIDSIINKYNGKILLRDNKKISISIPFKNSPEFFDEISGLVNKYIIMSKNNDLIFIDLFLKK